jgi:hypothetical protein
VIGRGIPIRRRARILAGRGGVLIRSLCHLLIRRIACWFIGDVATVSTTPICRILFHPRVNASCAHVHRTVSFGLRRSLVLLGAADEVALFRGRRTNCGVSPLTFSPARATDGNCGLSPVVLAIISFPVVLAIISLLFTRER